MVHKEQIRDLLKESSELPNPNKSQEINLKKKRKCKQNFLEPVVSITKDLTLTLLDSSNNKRKKVKLKRYLKNLKNAEFTT